MHGMIDGRRLKRAWDEHALGALVAGEPPYEYDDGPPGMQAGFLRMRQVADFLQCRSRHERAARLPELYDTLQTSEHGWARAAALFLQRRFGPPPEGGAPEQPSHESAPPCASGGGTNELSSG